MLCEYLRRFSASYISIARIPELILRFLIYADKFRNTIVPKIRIFPHSLANSASKLVAANRCTAVKAHATPRQNRPAAGLRLIMIPTSIATTAIRLANAEEKKRRSDTSITFLSGTHPIHLVNAAPPVNKRKQENSRLGRFVFLYKQTTALLRPYICRCEYCQR